MEQGVEDVLKGDPGAIRWLHSGDFAHYCSWLEIDATAARNAIEARRKVTKVKWRKSDLDRIKALHDNGVTWNTAITEVYGYYSETLRIMVRDYAAFTRQTA